MSKHQSNQPLLPIPQPPADGRTFINPSLWFVDKDGYRVVYSRYQPLYRMALNDKVHIRQVAVALRQSRLATQEEIARAFGHSMASQRRWERRYEEEGLEGLRPKPRSGRPRDLDQGQEAFVRRWFGKGVSNREMARRLGVGEGTIRRTLERLGLKRSGGCVQRRLAGMEEAASSPVEASEAEQLGKGEEVAAEEGEAGGSSGGGRLREASRGAAVGEATFTIDSDPMDRSGDRALARQGLLADAMPLFAGADQVPRAGVLLAVPLLASHGLVEVFQRVYGSLRPAFYGLRTMVVTLFLCALLRIKRPEQLKEYGPKELGRIVGLDRVPEVKTVRRKLSRLAGVGRGRVLMNELARRRIGEDRDRVAFLYVDGHVREYTGKHAVSRAKKAQRQIATPAATDNWVHDGKGEPLLVVTSQMNEKLTQVLEPILEEVKELVPEGDRITVIFDRGGFSAKLFSRLMEKGFDVITYRKGSKGKLSRSHFAKRRGKIEGRWVSYELCDRPRVRVGRLRNPGGKRSRVKGPQYLWLREVRVWREDGRQTAVLTSRNDLSGVEVAYRIFGRWRQENFFKYMAEEFALDALVEYGVEEVSEELDRRNPKWVKVDKELRQARGEVRRLEAALGKEASENEEGRCATMRGFKIKHAGLRAQLRKARARVSRLEKERKGLAKRIPASDLGALKSERKLISDSIKMAAYQVETELLRMLEDHYARSADEGRTLLTAAFQSPASLEVREGQLQVTIRAQSSPHRTQAVAGLCEQLNQMKAYFPGTRLRLRFAVEPHEPLIS